MKLKATLLLCLLACAWPLYASSGHGDGIPWKVIGQQAVNVACVIALLVYLTKKTVRDYFSARYDKYFEGVRRAQEAKKQAEETKNEIQKKLNTLLAEAERNQETAQKEATEMYNKMLADTEKQASKIKEEAFRTVSNELEKTKMRLHKELLEAALSEAHSGLETEVKKMDPGHFKKEFSQKMRVVQ